MIEVTLIENPASLASLRDEWNALLGASSGKTIFLTHEWVVEWWHVFGGGRRLFVLVAKDDGKIVGIAPLMISGGRILGIKADKLEFIGMPLSDYSDFIISGDVEEVLRSFFAFIDSRKADWSYISLNHMLETSPSRKLIQKIFAGKRLFGTYQTDIAPSLVFEGNNENVNRCISDRSAKRTLKVFHDSGGGRLENCIENLCDARALLRYFFELHKKRWNSTSTPSIFNDAAFTRFFESAMLALMKKGEANIFYLTVEGKPIAFIIVFTYDNIYLQYMSVHDTSISEFYPGVVLLIKSLEYNLLKKYREYDFMRGGEKYKLKYANRIKRLYKLIIHRNPLLYALESASSVMEWKVKQDEKLYDFFIRFEKKLRIV